MSLPTAVVGLLGCALVVALPFLLTAFTPPVVTRAGYEALAIGMDAAGAARAIGHPGEEQAVETTRGGPRRTLVWTNPDGSTVTATFENGALVSKVAERLR